MNTKQQGSFKYRAYKATQCRKMYIRTDKTISQHSSSVITLWRRDVLLKYYILKCEFQTERHVLSLLAISVNRPSARKRGTRTLEVETQRFGKGTALGLRKLLESMQSLSGTVWPEARHSPLLGHSLHTDTIQNCPSQYRMTRNVQNLFESSLLLYTAF